MHVVQRPQPGQPGQQRPIRIMHHQGPPQGPPQGHPQGPPQGRDKCFSLF